MPIGIIRHVEIVGRKRQWRLDEYQKESKGSKGKLAVVGPLWFRPKHEDSRQRIGPTQDAKVKRQIEIHAVKGHAALE